MSDATTERREEIVEKLRRLGVARDRIPEIAGEAEEFVEAGEEPGDAVREVFFRRAVEEKRDGRYRLI